MKFEFGFIWRMDEKKTVSENIALAQERHRVKFNLPAEIININQEDFKELIKEILLVVNVSDMEDSGIIFGVPVINVKYCRKGELFVGRVPKETPSSQVVLCGDQETTK